MSDCQRAAAICEELATVFVNATRDGKSHERIDELIEATERAAREISEIARRR